MSASVISAADLDAQVQHVKDRIATAQREAARAEVVHTTARAALTDAVRCLQDEFDVSSVSAAHALLAELEGQLRTQLAAISAQLDAVQVDTALPAT